MRYRKQDSAGDYSFGNGLADFYIDLPQTVAQAVMTRLKLWVGEWFLDTAEGTPWEQSALGTNKMNTVEPAIRARILETEGVKSIVEFELLWDSANRHLVIESTIDTIYGEAPLTGVL